MKFKQILLATGFISALGAAAASSAETRTLYVGMNGGSMEKNYTSYIFPEFEKANNVKIVVVPGTSADIMAKMSAQKDKPQMHLVFLDDGVMYRAVGMGLCQKLKDAPVFKEIYPFVRMANDQAVGIELGTVGIGCRSVAPGARCGHGPDGFRPCSHGPRTDTPARRCSVKTPEMRAFGRVPLWLGKIFRTIENDRSHLRIWGNFVKTISWTMQNP